VGKNALENSPGQYAEVTEIPGQMLHIFKGPGSTKMWEEELGCNFGEWGLYGHGSLLFSPVPKQF
jgi:hypothetical protein